MLCADLVGARQERGGARNACDSRAPAPRERKPFDSAREQLGGFFRPMQGPGACARVRGLDAATDGVRSLSRGPLQVSSSRTRDRHQQVEAVEQRPRELVPVRGEARGRAGALRGRIAARPAWAQVHGRDELKSSREDDPAADSRDRDRSVLQRLAQCLERVPSELGELVEEEHAVVCEARLAWLRARPAADDRRDTLCGAARGTAES